MPSAESKVVEINLTVRNDTSVPILEIPSEWPRGRRWIRFTDKSGRERYVKPNSRTCSAVPRLILDPLGYWNGFGGLMQDNPINCTLLDAPPTFGILERVQVDLVYEKRFKSLLVEEEKLYILRTLCKEAFDKLEPFLVHSGDLIAVQLRALEWKVYFRIAFEESRDAPLLLDPKSTSIQISLNQIMHAIPPEKFQSNLTSLENFKELRNLCEAFRKEDPSSLTPLGVLVVGRIGSGKRWLAEQVMYSLSIRMIDYFDFATTDETFSRILFDAILPETCMAVIMEHPSGLEWEDRFEKLRELLRLRACKVILIGAALPAEFEAMSAKQKALFSFVLDMADYTSLAEHALEAIGDERLRNACRVLPTPATVNLAILRYRHLSAISQSPPDIAEIVEKIQKEMLENSESIVSTKTVKVTWNDVGGMEEAKRKVQEHVANLSSSLYRHGILFYGPPGTGKTFLAKAIATEYKRAFFSVKGPELLSMYVGQTESNIRQVFKDARKAAPSVLFFDEFDSLAVSRGRDADSGGIADRIVAQLITEFDCTFGSGANLHDVLIIAATNRPDLLDPALVRAGRFEQHIFFGSPDSLDERVRILERASSKYTTNDSTFTSRFTLDPSVSLTDLAKQCPQTMTPAELAGLCREAAKIAVRQYIKGWRRKDEEIPVVKVPLCHEHFNEALSKMMMMKMNEPTSE